MTAPLETEHLDVLTIVTGHYRQTSGYSAYRSKGTRDWLLVYTVGGKGRFGFGRGEITTEPGAWVLLRPGTLHDYGVESSLKQWELLWAHFQPHAHWLPLLVWPAVNRGLMKLRISDAAISEKAVARFFQAHQLATGSLRQREMLAMNALEEVLLWCDQSNAQSQPPDIDPRTRDAMDYLVQHLHEKLTLDDVAAHVGLSVSRFAHLFKAETGQTPQQFLEAHRLGRAAQLLLRTTFSVKQIASAVGYDSPFYFSLRFKARLRLSPKAFRQKNRSAD
ncbi:helix-turn-helix domain-containing protein [soil metagenome]